MALNERPPAVQARNGALIRIEGREYVYFGGCDYLGLATDPQVVAAAQQGFSRHGLSPGASRTTSGETSEHLDLERELALRLQAPSALLTAGGYLAAGVALQGLGGGFARALVDEAAHASLLDAARAAGLATETYAHLDFAALSAHLSRGGPSVVLTDSVFPSRGEAVDVDALVSLTSRHGATLLLDDCHATGVLGPRGLGSSEHPRVPGPGVVVVSTLSKALGTFGGFVLGTKEDIERMRAGSAPYAGATPIPAGIAAAACTALRLAFEGVERRARLNDNIARLRSFLGRQGLSPAPLAHPVHALAELRGRPARELARRLARAGLWVPCVGYLGEAELLRLVVTASHTDEHMAALEGALATL